VTETPGFPLDEILEALDLSRAQPGSGFLEALFVRFIDRVPFENASKIVRDADVADPAGKPRIPEVFWSDHLERGAGGTCFARVAAFDALLTALGFRTQRRLGMVRTPGDHAALFVDTPTGEVLVDVGFPVPAVLPARGGFVEGATGAYRVERQEAEGGLRIRFEAGVPEGPQLIVLDAAPVSPERYDEGWRRTFARGAQFLREVTLRRDLPGRVLAFTRGEARVDDLHSRLRVPLPGPRAAAVAALFGIDVELLERAFAIVGDPAAPETDTTLTAYLEFDGSPDAAFAAITRPDGYRRLIEGVGSVGSLRETAAGFALELSSGTQGAGGAAGVSLIEDVSPDVERRRLAIVRRSGAPGSVAYRSAYSAQKRDGRTFLLREATLPGVREDLLRNDSLRGRLAGPLALDLLAWKRML
jgi:hypothetical protein